MKCSNCGNELSNNDVFCNNCGQEVLPQSKNTDKTFCANCGAELESGMDFCGECGAPVGSLDKSNINYIFCGNCGERMPDNLQICTNCGQKLHIDSNEHSDRKQSGKKHGIIIAVLVIVVLALAAMIIGYFFYDNSNDNSDNTENLQVTISPKASKTPAETPAETPAATPQSTDNQIGDISPNISTNVGKLETYYIVNCNTSISLRETPSTSSKVLKDIPLGSPVSYVEASQNGFAKIIYNGTTGYALQSYLSNNAGDIRKPNNNPSPENNVGQSGNNVVSNPTYKTYNDTAYNFSCAYPAHFQVNNDSDKFVRYSVKAPDNSATLKICATSNSSHLSVKNVMDNFKSSYPGTVDYENSGDTWCAICTIQNGQCHYGYFHVGSSDIRGFEMHYNRSYYSIYDKYVNDIYDSLKFN